ncbi:hypothetical protein J2847_004613 [Azospirillum agricola]|uniref:hypothetical protein n=1 Tax=Azospirillum agricola TaxID=1720247 RepID=UPI001AE50A35|nr:hypothetical protein [Azospirillum agricola]MBP2231301.1 hypothetical protein [Azospirillum agricola]
MSAQHLLFDDLPETERVRKPARRSRATSIAAPVAVDMVREAVPMPASAALAASCAATLPLGPPAPPAPPPPFDPGALSNPELRAVVQAIPDARLSYLLIEAARELKRRALPDRADDDESGETAEPNPMLLRAARQVVGELAGDDA